MVGYYYDLALEYLEKVTVDHFDEIMASDDCDAWLRNYDGSYFINDHRGARLLVPDNLSYVMRAVKNANISDSEVADYFCNENWDKLDYIAKKQAYADALDEAIERANDIINVHIPEDWVYVFITYPLNNNEEKISAITKGGDTAKKTYWSLMKKYGKVEYKTVDPNCINL